LMTSRVDDVNVYVAVVTPDVAAYIVVVWQPYAPAKRAGPTIRPQS
jgi:hypothetical protein